MSKPIKISLTIHMEGSVMVRHDKPEFIGKLKHYPKVARPVTQILTMTEDAYDHFISDNVPPKTKKHDWARLSRKQRVAYHCKQICEHIGGLDYEFTIFED